MSAVPPMAPLVYWLTLTDVARALDVHRHAVRRLITGGPLRACRFGGRLRVHSTDLAAYLARASR